MRCLLTVQFEVFAPSRSGSCQIAVVFHGLFGSRDLGLARLGLYFTVFSVVESSWRNSRKSASDS